jgi:hypothetical protein
MTPQDQTAETRAQVARLRSAVLQRHDRADQGMAQRQFDDGYLSALRDVDKALAAPVAREPQPTMAGHGVNWMVVRQRECFAPEVWSFGDEQAARTFHEQAQTQWTNCALTRVVKFGAQVDRPLVAREEPSAEARVAEWDGGVQWPDSFARWWVCRKCRRAYASPTTGKPPAHCTCFDDHAVIAVEARETAGLRAALENWRTDIDSDDARYGPPVLLYAESFIDEDFIPDGVVEGCWQDDAGWKGAFWNPEFDAWDTRVCEPSHWMAQPTAPRAALTGDQP